MLTRMGYDVEAVIDGDAALQRLENESFHVLLTDLQMPCMDGLQLTRQVRCRFTGDRSMIIVALTANAMGGDRERCLAAGMDDYVSKPIKAADLAEVLDRWTESIRSVNADT